MHKYGSASYYMRISQQAVADLAGVSRGTVDRVINNKPNVKPETRERVLAAVEKLGYSPNSNGRALALCKKQFTVTAVCPGPEVPFFSDVLAGIEAAKNELGDFNFYVDYIFTYGKTSESVIAEIDNASTQAVMIAAEDTPIIQKTVKKVTSRKIPVITFNSDISKCGRLCFVGQNLYKSGRIAASLMQNLLRGEKAKVIIVAGSQRFQAHKARIDGFIDALGEYAANIRIADVLETNDEYEKTYHALSDSLSGHSDIKGIYLASGHINGALEAILESGKKYAAVANDLSPAIEKALKDDIFDFTIYQNPFEQGYKPVMLLFDYLLKGIKPSQTIYYTDNTIITKEMI